MTERQWNKSEMEKKIWYRFMANAFSHSTNGINYFRKWRWWRSRIQMDKGYVTAGKEEKGILLDAANRECEPLIYSSSFLPHHMQALYVWIGQVFISQDYVYYLWSNIKLLAITIQQKKTGENENGKVAGARKLKWKKKRKKNEMKCRWLFCYDTLIQWIPVSVCVYILRKTACREIGKHKHMRKKKSYCMFSFHQLSTESTGDGSIRRKINIWNVGRFFPVSLRSFILFIVGLV